MSDTNTNSAPVTNEPKAENQNTPPSGGPAVTSSSPADQKSAPVTPAPTTTQTPTPQKARSSDDEEMINVRKKSFRERMEREAVRIIKKRYGGKSLEEIDELVKRASAVNQSTGSETDNPGDLAAQALRQENERLRQERDAAAAERDLINRKAQKQVQRARDEAFESELKASAIKLGANDADYAIHLFARNAASGDETPPDQFFANLKKTHAFLFAPTPPTVVQPTTTPVSGNSIQGTPPTGVAPGSSVGTPPKDVNEMSEDEFAAHRRRYGGFAP